MYFSGNPAAQLWRRVMQQVHSGLENKSFPAPQIGAATNIFGNLDEAYREQEYKKTHPDEPEESDKPQETEAPAESDPPQETEAPAETEEPVPEETASPVEPTEPVEEE